MKFLYYILIAIVLLFNYSCSNQPVKTKEEKEEVVVHKEIKEEYFDFFYNDASVSPDYHRSYDINIRIDSITVLIDSYSDTLFFKKIKSPKDVFKKLNSFIEKNKIRSNEKEFNDDENSCTGAYSISIYSYVNKKETKLSLTSCNTDIDSNKFGDISGILNDIKREFVAAFDSWMASTMKKN